MPGDGGPAVLHPAADGLPVVITVDTSLLVASIDASDQHHSIAWSVYRSLVESGTVVAICQPLLMPEFWSAMRKTSNRLEADPRLAFVTPDVPEPRTPSSAWVGDRMPISVGEAE